MNKGYERIRRARMARRARRITCPRCKAEVLEGYDHDWSARLARVEPTPVGEALELACLLEGLCSYDLIPAGSRGEASYLDRRLGSGLARRYFPVLVEHVCGRALPRDRLAPPKAQPDPDNPPF